MRAIAGSPTAASVIASRRARRRMISLRTAITWRGAHKSVYASAIAISAHNIEPAIAEPSIRNTEAGWWRVFHQSTENFTIGRLMNPAKVMIETARAAL